MSKRQRKRCIVTNCNFEKVNPKLSCFRVSNDERKRLLWENALEQALKKNQTVCEKHFADDNVLWFQNHVDSDGKIVGIVSENFIINFFVQINFLLFSYENESSKLAIAFNNFRRCVSCMHVFKNIILLFRKNMENQEPKELCPCLSIMSIRKTTKPTT